MHRTACLGVLVTLALSFPLLTIAPQAQALDECALCKGTGTIFCTTCAEKGYETGVCWICDGEGTEPCRFCTRIADYIREKKLCPTCKGRRKDCPDCGGITRALLTAKGKVPCPNEHCVNGEVKWEFSTARCLLCMGRNRSLDCISCTDGTMTCRLCRGKKRDVRWPCRDCAGAGRVPCPLCTEVPAECPWCGGKGERPCPGKSEPGDPPLVCLECEGFGWEPCWDCFGSSRMACAHCWGTGYVEYVMATRDGTITTRGGRKDCKDCNRKGWTPCTSCTKGRTDCAKCKKTGSREGHCFLCLGEGKLECEGCKPRPFVAFERAGTIVLEAGHHERAIRWLEIAQEKATKHYAEPLGEDAPPERIAARVEERDAVLERLATKLATAHAYLELGGGGK